VSRSFSFFLSLRHRELRCLFVIGGGVTGGPGNRAQVQASLFQIRNPFSRVHCSPNELFTQRGD